MEVRLGNVILGLAASLCVWDAITAPKGMGTEAVLALVLAFLLIRRAFVKVPQSVRTVVGGCAAVAVIVAGDRGLLNANKPLWIVVMVLGFLFLGFGDRIEGWLKTDGANRAR